jgi:hypothetical protein
MIRPFVAWRFRGEAVDCPLPAEGAWQMVGIKDVSLGQTAHQLAAGRLWVEGMPSTSPILISVCSIADVIRRIGPHHRDIAGSQIKQDGLPQGPFEIVPGSPVGAAYPCLWNHDNSRERRLVVEPDSWPNPTSSRARPAGVTRTGGGTLGDCYSRPLQS